MAGKGIARPKPMGLASSQPGVHPGAGEKRGLRRAVARGAPAAAPVAAGVKSKLGAANEGGMGLSTGALRSLGVPLGDNPRADAPLGDAPLGDSSLDYPCEEIGGVRVASFSCSRATFDFLRSNVLRNPGDIDTIILYGLQKFDRTIGQHQIALDKGGRDTPNSVARDGAIVVPDGKALIVTDFVGLASETVWGLPGALREIDIAALSRNLCFSLVQQNGAQVLPQQVLLGGVKGTFCNGTPYLRDSAIHGYPALTQTSKMPVQATYTVQVPPYPGFPDVIGARVKGYLVSQQLLAAVQDRPVTNG